MALLQVQRLIDFAPKCSTRSDSSLKRRGASATDLTTANSPGHDRKQKKKSHGVIRVPVYIRWKKHGTSVVPDQTVRTRGRSAVAGGGRWQVRPTGKPWRRRRSGLALKNAGRSGLAAVALRNAGHIGRVGDGPKWPGSEDWYRSTCQRRGLGAGGDLWRGRAAESTAPIASAFHAGQGADRTGFCDLIVAEGKCWSQARGGQEI